MKVRKIFEEAIGWYGTIAIIGAFILVSFEVIRPTDILYQVLNGTGALGIVYISFLKKAYQPGVLNIIWAIVASIALLRVLL